MENLHIVAGWVIVLFMALLGVIILWKMIQGPSNGIDLRYLIS